MSTIPKETFTADTDSQNLKRLLGVAILVIGGHGYCIALINLILVPWKKWSVQITMALQKVVILIMKSISQFRSVKCITLQ